MSTKAHCCHILVKTLSEASTIKSRLDKGEKFGEIAKKVSLCPSSKKGGDLGIFTRGKMVKEFEKVAFELQKGQVSEPVKTQFGYHIIKRLE
ncbi:MAG: peptidylprolyl isomerase [Candidatus Bathyarchaeia archaeon]|jgi:parvulin-like peptidyl-prolyl isomerase